MKARRMIAVFLVIGALVLFATQCFFRVDARQCAVLTTFGKPTRVCLEAGLYYKLPPPVHSVSKFDRRLQFYETNLIEYLTGDKKNIIARAFVCWSIRDPLQYLTAIRGRGDAEQKIDDIVCALIGSTLGDYEMANLFSATPGTVKIEEIEERITRGVEEKLGADYGLEVRTVAFSRLALPEDNARSVYERMKAERKTIANEYRALGREEADKLVAEVDRQRSDILAEAYRQSQVLRGKGEAEAAAIYAKAYGKSPEFFRLVRTLEAYKKIFGENTTLVLSSDSDLLQYLNRKGRKSKTTSP